MRNTKLALRWWPESSDLGSLGSMPAHVRQVTSAPAITHNIYCEQPYCSADGNRLALLRKSEPDPLAPSDLLIYDIPTYRMARLERHVRGVNCVAGAAWSGVLFVSAGDGSSRHLVRFDLNTLEGEDLFSLDGFPPDGISTVSADHRFGLGSAHTHGGKFGIFRLDLHTGDWRQIFESPDICNPHLQFRLHTASRILVQENRGAVVDQEGNVVRACDERGGGLFSLDANGTDRRDFPVGLPITASPTGHECWIGDTDHALATLEDVYDDGHRSGVLVELGHDWPKPRVVRRSPSRWIHVCASRCGRYFVTDQYTDPTQPTQIIVGSIRTGETGVLCEVITTAGGGQYTHLHPYLTSDNRWVVFNSDRTGLAQVYLAAVPDGFLDALENESHIGWERNNA